MKQIVIYIKKEGNKSMAIKLDTDKLQDHIESLTTLRNNIVNNLQNKKDVGENSGRSIEKIVAIENSFQSIQDGLEKLLHNTIMYMNQRKESVERKEQVATEEVSK